MEEIKPIKRSKELAPLSREHHNGLLFAWKIKQGLVNGTPVETLCNYTRWFWSNHMEPHFKDEEKVLVKFLPGDSLLVRQMTQEHAQIRDLVVALDKKTDLNSLKLLSDFINSHIRFEERELFPYVEKTLSPEQLSEVYNNLSDKLHCDTDPIAVGWKDEFWVRK